MLTRRITFRLYPSVSQEQRLFEARRLQAYLYNAAVANRKNQYQKFGYSVDYFEQQASLPGFKEVRKRKPERRQCQASRRWKKAQKKISKLKKKVAQQRQNWVHHQAVEIVSGNSLIATEKLSLKNMTRQAKKRCDPAAVSAARASVRFNRERAPRQGSKRKRQKAGLNRSLLDVGIGMLKQAIAYKAKEAGAIYLEAPTRSLKPTQRCALCWKLTKKDLSDRLHICSNKECNHTEDRDINSAQVCLAWARGQELPSKTADESSSTANPKFKHCGGFQQLAQVKRQKLMAYAKRYPLGQRSSHE